MSTTNSKQYFKIEELRRNLAREKNYISLTETYKSSLTIQDSNTKEFWDNKFSSNYEKFIKNPMEIDRNQTAFMWFCVIIKPNLRQKTLNIGCGDGNFERYLDKLRMKIDHVGIDKAKKTIQKLKHKFPNFKFFAQDIFNGKSPSPEFQIISLFEVLEHIPPRKTFKLLNRIHGMLSNNGYLLISVPMNEGLEEMFPNNPNAHLRCYSKELLCAELEIAGFRIIKTKSFFAFNKFYGIKNFLARFILFERWRPNNLLVLAQK